MTDPSPALDRYATGYERHWAPVLAPSVANLLDRHDPLIAGGVQEVLDVGAGTGNLALAAVRRWPAVRVTAIDASAEMLDALVAAVRSGPADERERLATHVALAAELPFDDGRFDLVLSSFVLQLVPDRAAALREIRRVLRPGGSLGYVTWIADDRAFAPDRVFDAVLAEFGFEDEPDDERTGDVPSAEVAAAELRAADFADVAAEAAVLRHAFSVESYLSFLVDFDEESTFESMSRAERRRFLIRLREGLMALSPDDLAFTAPIVYASARRPAD